MGISDDSVMSNETSPLLVDGQPPQQIEGQQPPDEDHTQILEGDLTLRLVMLFMVSACGPTATNHPCVVATTPQVMRFRPERYISVS